MSSRKLFLSSLALLLFFVSWSTGQCAPADDQPFATNWPGAKQVILSHGLRKPRHGGIYVIAHRGAHQGIPENTLAAYRQAIELGVDFVEVDIRTTKDHRYVSVHNRSLEAYVPGQRGNVSDFTLAELKAFDIGSRIGPEWAAERIPTFEEILDLCRGKCGIYLDLKDAPIAPLVQLIKLHGLERDVLWYASYDELEQLQQRCPRCLPMPDPGPQSHLGPLLEQLKPTVVAAVWKHYSRDFVRMCHQAGALVLVDEDTPACWKTALTWETDGIQTDHPQQLIQWLKNHAARH